MEKVVIVRPESLYKISEKLPHILGLIEHINPIKVITTDNPTLNEDEYVVVATYSVDDLQKEIKNIDFQKDINKLHKI